VAPAVGQFLSSHSPGTKPFGLMSNILNNIANNPSEAKYRRINIEKVVKKLGEDGDGVVLLLAVGFTETLDGQYYELKDPDVTVIRECIQRLQPKQTVADVTAIPKQPVPEAKRPGLEQDTEDTEMKIVDDVNSNSSEQVSDVTKVAVSTDEAAPSDSSGTEAAAAVDGAEASETANPQPAKEETKTVKKPAKKPQRSFAERGGISGSGIDLEAELDRRTSDGSSKYSNKLAKKKPGATSGMDLYAAVDRLGGDDKYTRAMKSGKKLPKSGVVNLADSIDGVQHKKVLTSRKKGPHISNLDAAIDGDKSKTFQKRSMPKAKINPSMLDAAVEEM